MTTIPIGTDIAFSNIANYYPLEFIQAANKILDANELNNYLGLIALPIAPISPAIKIDGKFLLIKTLQAELEYSQVVSNLTDEIIIQSEQKIQALESLLENFEPCSPDIEQPIAHCLSRLANTSHFKLFSPRITRSMHLKYSQLVDTHGHGYQKFSERLRKFVSYTIILAEIITNGLPTSWHDFDPEIIDRRIKEAIITYAQNGNLSVETVKRIRGDWQAVFYLNGLDNPLIKLTRAIGQKKQAKSFISKIKESPLPENDSRSNSQKNKKANSRLSPHYIEGRHPEIASLSAFDANGFPASIYKTVWTWLYQQDQANDPNIYTKRAVFHILHDTGQTPEWIAALAADGSASPQWIPKYRAISYQPDNHIGWSEEVEEMTKDAAAGDHQARANLRLMEHTYQSVGITHYVPVSRLLNDCFLANKPSGLILPWFKKDEDNPRSLNINDISLIIDEWNNMLNKAGIFCQNITAKRIQTDFSRHFHVAGLNPEFLYLVSGKGIPAYQLSCWYGSTTAERLFTAYDEAYLKVIQTHAPRSIDPTINHPAPQANLGSWRVAKTQHVELILKTAIDQYVTTHNENDDINALLIVTQVLLILCLLIFLGLRPFEIGWLKKNFLVDDYLTIDAKTHAGREGTRVLPLPSIVQALIHQMISYLDQTENQPGDLFDGWDTDSINHLLYDLAGQVSIKSTAEAYAWRYKFYSFAMQWLPTEARRYVMGHETQGIESNNAYLDFNFSELPEQLETLSKKIIKYLNIDLQEVIYYASKNPTAS